MTPDQVIRPQPVTASVTKVNAALSVPWTLEEQATGRFLPASMCSSTCSTFTQALISYYTDAGWMVIHTTRNGEGGHLFTRPRRYGVREDY